jgi:hypothetical protein
MRRDLSGFNQYAVSFHSVVVVRLSHSYRRPQGVASDDMVVAVNQTAGTVSQDDRACAVMVALVLGACERETQVVAVPPVRAGGSVFTILISIPRKEG